MPRKYLMTWVESRKRWMKMYRGKRYVVSCRALNAPATKEASYRPANEWWEVKLAEVGQGPPMKDHRVQALELAAGRPLGSSEEAHEALQAVLFRISSDPDWLPPEGFNRLWLGEERFGQIEEGMRRLAEGPPPEPDRTVKGQADGWVATQQAFARAGKITPDRADNNRIALEHFRAFLGDSSPLEVIDAARLHGYFLHCLGRVTERKGDGAGKKGWSPDYAGKVFGVARQFVKSLWEAQLIELPRNIDSKTFRFGTGARKVRTWDVEEVRAAVGRATGQLKLHLLLMANCGMLQTDISDLRQDEVDWEGGRIVRRRSKTGRHEDVPLVDYKLWPPTSDLLKRHRSKDPEYALLTEAGNRWVCKRMSGEGRLVKADNIASCYAWLKKKTGNRKPLKQLRKTSATLIEGHKEYGRYKGHFLGHSPRTLADRHYAAPSRQLFDEVVDWLGRQYGFC